MTDFCKLHRPREPLLCPNPCGIGSAQLLAGLGFTALATPSSGFAATLGQREDRPTRAWPSHPFAARCGSRGASS